MDNTGLGGEDGQHRHGGRRWTTQAWGEKMDNTGLGEDNYQAWGKIITRLGGEELNPCCHAKMTIMHVHVPPLRIPT